VKPIEYTWAQVMRKLGKTMIACARIKQAQYIADYLNKKGVGAVVSESENDVDSENIKAFMENETTKVLIVVNRGILGFDYAELGCVIDMTCSTNIDRIYQLFSRVVRKDPKNKKKRKLFVKVSPKIYDSYMHFVMTAMLTLTS